MNNKPKYFHIDTNLYPLYYLDTDLYYVDFENKNSKFWQALHSTGLTITVLELLGPAGGNPNVRLIGTKHQIFTFLKLTLPLDSVYEDYAWIKPCCR